MTQTSFKNAPALFTFASSLMMVLGGSFIFGSCVYLSMTNSLTSAAFHEPFLMSSLLLICLGFFLSFTCAMHRMFYITSKEEKAHNERLWHMSLVILAAFAMGTLSVWNVSMRMAGIST